MKGGNYGRKTMEEYQQIDVEQAQEDQQEYKEDEQFLTSNQTADDGYSGITGYSEPKPLGGLYALFQDVMNQPSSIKVSNLDKGELGDLGITVRESMRIALLANTFRHPIFARYFFNQGLITTDSAMSKKGWFTELFVTSKKFAQRDTSSSVNLPQQQKKWSLFSNNQPPQQ